MTELSPSPLAIPALPRRAGALPNRAPHGNMTLWLMADPRIGC